MIDTKKKESLSKAFSGAKANREKYISSKC